MLIVYSEVKSRKVLCATYCDENFLNRGRFASFIVIALFMIVDVVANTASFVLTIMVNLRIEKLMIRPLPACEVGRPLL